MTAPSEVERIARLTPQERVAGYLVRQAQLAECGARLRTKYKDVATDFVEGWTPDEEAEWDRLADACDPWFHALNEEEKLALRDAERLLGTVCRAEWPPQPFHWRKQLERKVLDALDPFRGQRVTLDLRDRARGAAQAALDEFRQEHCPWDARVDVVQDVSDDHQLRVRVYDARRSQQQQERPESIPVG